MDYIYNDGIDVYVARGDLPTEIDAINLLTEIGAIQPTTNENGKFFASEDGKIYVL